MTNGSVMKDKSIAECPPWSILQYFWPALSNYRSWKPIFTLLFEWPLKAGFTVSLFPPNVYLSCMHHICYIQMDRKHLPWKQTQWILIRLEQSNLGPYCLLYSKTCLKQPLKKMTKIGFQHWLSLNAGQKYCRMLKESILQYFLPPLRYHFSLRSLFCLFLSDRIRQVLLYKRPKCISRLESWRQLSLIKGEM